MSDAEIIREQTDLDKVQYTSKKFIARTKAAILSKSAQKREDIVN